MDRFEDLRTFLTLTQAGGFAAAGERLGIVKSAVSRRVRDIEERLDVRLLHRTSRQISLTDAGRLYLSRAIEILEAVRTLDDLVREEARGLSGSIRVAVPESFAANCLGHALLHFRRAHPDVVIEVDTRDGAIDMVLDAVDVAIGPAPLRHSGLVAQRLLDVRHAVCASPGYLDEYGRPATPDDLTGHAGIGCVGDGAHVVWELKDGLAARVGTGMRTTSRELMREAAKAGFGLAFLPTFVIAEAVASGSLEIVLERFEPEPYPMHLVLPASRNVPTRVRALVEHLVGHYANSAASDLTI